MRHRFGCYNVLAKVEEEKNLGLLLNSNGKWKNHEERVQRKLTRILPHLRLLPYKERLKRLNLMTLSDRRKRGDLIQLFKSLSKRKVYTQSQ